MSVTCSGSERVLSEICRVPYLFGVFPFNLLERRFHLSKRQIVIHSLLMFVHFALGALFATHPSAFYTNSQLTYSVYFVQVMGVRLSILSDLIWLALNRSALTKLLSATSSVDLFLATNGQNLRIRISLIEDIVGVGFVSCIGILHLSNRGYNLWHISKSFTYYYCISVALIISIQFRRFVTYLSLGFFQLRKSLLVKCLSHIQLEKVILQFDNLYRAANTLDYLFGPQTFLLIFCCFITTTANIYFCYYAWILELNIWENCVRFCWVITFILIGHNIISPCMALAREVKELNALLYQIMIDDKSSEIANNKKLRLHIAMKREIVFKACGFFSVDYSLVHSMIAAGTTYLVILIQVTQPSQVKMSTLGAIAKSTNSTIMASLPDLNSTTPISK